MLEKATIVRPYAEAAFSQALEEDKLSEWSAMLNLLSTIVHDSDMQRVIASPKINADELYQFIIDICDNKLSQSGKNFVKICVDAGRISLASEISVLFEQKRSTAEGVSGVDVITAYPLDENQIKEITKSLSKRTGNKININIEEDKDLIGGVIIRVGDSVVDASLRGRLKELNNVIAQ
ncbi:MAG: F0F1 ATP synthase subunit delta [Pseudomonadota bacterium]|nr:F0F1 ATP synthase subunit delta [Pseudomonadota bacterium]